jgi:hypothetical protein
MLDMFGWLLDGIMPNHNEILIEDCLLLDVPRNHTEILTEERLANLDRFGSNHNEIVLAE